jgi:trans-AT polyketide synthase/acyltransferase/oxidoreductase domain-containing protein
MSSIHSAFKATAIKEAVSQVRETLIIVKHPTQYLFGVLIAGDPSIPQFIIEHKLKEVARLAPLYPEYLGSPQFLQTHKVRFPYIVGEMANGIATAHMVIAAAKAGFIGSFGAGGLMPDIVEKNILNIQENLGPNAENWASNLIHSPNEPELERRIIDLYLRLNVTRVSSSAYMQLSPHIVYYAFKGIYVNQAGNIVRKNHVLAKLSRPEVAEHFLSPPPRAILSALIAEGKLTEQEAKLASELPVAEDITVESDSGGHTDNRPLCALFPVIKQQSIILANKFNYEAPVRIGAAGSLGTPDALAAAFSMGAAYVLTGSVNQAAVEAGVCEAAKRLLMQADIADVEMAPAADMFELGVKLQVLKRGTLFGRRAAKLYQYFVNYPTLEAIPQADRAELEKTIFRQPLDKVWENTKAFFSQRDPKQIEIAEKDAKYRMALVFRAYLGQTSRWAIIGDESRVMDYQLWCGPAMGSFNRWVKGTFLEELKNRTVEQIGYNLLEGAAVITRAQQLRSMGVVVPAQCFEFEPRLLG